MSLRSQRSHQALLVLAIVAHSAIGNAVESSLNVTLHSYVEQRVKTSACEDQQDLSCTTLLFSERADAYDTYSVNAGYLVFTDKDEPVVLNIDTRQKIVTTTLTQATTMAQILFDTLSVTHSQTLCQVTVDQIAQAIIKASQFSSKCPDTDHPYCFAFFKIAVCPIDRQ